jgi:hypothetical protein
MEVILLKSGEFSFNPAEKHTIFAAGSKVNLVEERARYLISVGWAKEVIAVEKVDVSDAALVKPGVEESLHKAVVDVPDFKKQTVTKHGRN